MLSIIGLYYNEKLFGVVMIVTYFCFRVFSLPLTAELACWIETVRSLYEISHL